MTKLLERFLSRKFRIYCVLAITLLFIVVQHPVGAHAEYTSHGFPLGWIITNPLVSIFELGHPSIDLGNFITNSLILYCFFTIPTILISKRTKKEMVK